MFSPERIEPRKNITDVAENQMRFASFYLNVNALVRENQFHVFVVLNNDMGHVSAGGPKHAGHRIEMLVEEATVNRLDSGKLATVKYEAFDFLLYNHGIC